MSFLLIKTWISMANSKYEYVKSFELEDEVMFPNLIVVRINGRDFSRFSQVYEFEKPNDEAALNLMYSCSSAILEEYLDIIFAYGSSDEYNFVFKKTSRFYQRRARYMRIQLRRKDSGYNSYESFRVHTPETGDLDVEENASTRNCDEAQRKTC
ncbi:tRNA(His) guanylyltransferase 1-like isoform X2 [Raphanus sativus]|uniref:tRNA(His) guanylyltransferase 1-like isoform X2 n=1 Tax=Raphanus sativus TaxID=3726 RepID=A0A9W3CMJ2_RAPSA|nr:tRNA(His) guanylyltransferase 1-like isoform X2 [Raphanus sativus]XP_056852811.1 tRNA(His) guanylyltransferase 1-like isoform X2 [Raphanus sativus]